MATQKTGKIFVKDESGNLLNLIPEPQVIVNQNLEYNNFPTAGDKTKLYVDKTTKKIYLWVE